MAGRPHTAIGTYGQIGVRRRGGRFLVAARYRDADGRLRVVTARGESQSAATANLKLRLLNRSGYGTSGMLSLGSSFGALVALWLADLELQDLVDQTEENYRDDIRLHMLPAFQYFTLGEIAPDLIQPPGDAYTTEERRRTTAMSNWNYGNPSLAGEWSQIAANSTKAAAHPFHADLPVLEILSSESVDTMPAWLHSHQAELEKVTTHQLEVLEGTHYLHWTQSPQMGRIITDFVDSHVNP